MNRSLFSFYSYENTTGREDVFSGSENDVEREAVLAVVRKAMEQELTKRQLECVRMYFFQNRTEQEIGSALGINKATVCRHLQKALRNLRRSVNYLEAVKKILPCDD